MTQAQPTQEDPWGDIPSSGGAYVKWTDVGTRVFGTVIEKRRGKSIDGDPVPELVLELSNGEGEVIVCASQVRLRSELMKASPNVGDKVDITFTGVDLFDGKSIKAFSVAVAPADDTGDVF